MSVHYVSMQVRTQENVKPSRSSLSTRALFGGLFGGSKIDDSQFYICVDCGYIYDLRENFSQMPNSFKCPACSAPKRRFKAYLGDIQGRPQNGNKAMSARMKERNWR
jgi:rubredoxin